MRYRNLGVSGLKISELVLGAATFGELADSSAVHAMVGVALDSGVTTFDTGDAYAEGRSEELLGRALRGQRDRVVICTKVGLRVGDSEPAHAAGLRSGYDHTTRWTQGISPNDQGMSRVHIMAAVDASLRRLGTDRIDVYQVHRWDPEVPIEETLGALDDLVRAGKIRHAGCSSYTGWQLMRSLWASDAHRLTRFTSMQVAYNLLSRDPEREALPACAAGGVGVLAFQPLAGGILTGRYEHDAGPEPGSRYAVRETYRARYWKPDVFEAVDRLRDLANKTGRTPGELAIGWLLSRPAVNAVLVGAERPEEVVQNLAAANRPLDGDEIEAVEECVHPRDDAPEVRARMSGGTDAVARSTR